MSLHNAKQMCKSIEIFKGVNEVISEVLVCLEGHCPHIFVQFRQLVDYLGCLVNHTLVHVFWNKSQILDHRHCLVEEVSRRHVWIPIRDLVLPEVVDFFFNLFKKRLSELNLTSYFFLSSRAVNRERVRERLSDR